MFNRKKSYFKKMLADLEKAIWETEFRKFTALQERELTRRQYDTAQDALARLSAIEKPTDEQKTQKEHAERAVENIKKQLQAIDTTITGGAPSELLPDGAEGIDNKLSSWVNRREYVKNFIKFNC